MLFFHVIENDLVISVPKYFSTCLIIILKYIFKISILQ